jgi:hypothetical protein
VNVISIALVTKIAERSRFGTKEAQDAVDGFLQMYRDMDWSDLHGTSSIFRNIGLAHLTPQQLEKRITFHLESLTRSVAKLAEHLHVLAPDSTPV